MCGSRADVLHVLINYMLVLRFVHIFQKDRRSKTQIDLLQKWVNVGAYAPSICLNFLFITMASDEASGGATRAPAPPTAMIYMEPGLSPGYRHEEEEEGKEGLEEAGGRRRGSQPWLRRFLASSLYLTYHLADCCCIWCSISNSQ